MTYDLYSTAAGAHDSPPPTPPDGHKFDANNYDWFGSINGSTTGFAEYLLDPPIPGTNPDAVGVDFITASNGACVIFDQADLYGQTQLPANVTVQKKQFYPMVVNDNGWAVGEFGGDYSLIGMWNGQSLDPLGDATSANTLVNGLNNQGQVALETNDNGEGYLWENGKPTVLVNHLPATLRGQISSIQPIAISNQTAPGTDATIYILAYASVNGTAATIVCSRDNNGNWTFAKIGLPGATIIDDWTSINASGVIAAIGNRGHALLLMPVSFEAQNGQINHGFDPNLKSASNPVTGPPHASVTLPSTNHVVDLVCGGPKLASQLELVITSGSDLFSILPLDGFSSLVNHLTLTGKQSTQGFNSVGTVEVRLKGSNIVLSTLVINILPLRTVHLGIYRIIDSLSQNTQNFVAPSDDAICKTLNDVYLQAGIHFVIDPHPKPDPTIVHYDQDPTNGLFDSGEENYFPTSGPDSSVGNNWVGQGRVFLMNHANPDLEAYGYGLNGSVLGLPAVYIFCGDLNPLGADISLAVAHEIGHRLELAAFPNLTHDPGPWPNGTSSVMRPGPHESVEEYGIAPSVNPGRWLRYQDWVKANNEGRDPFTGP